MRFLLLLLSVYFLLTCASSNGNQCVATCNQLQSILGKDVIVLSGPEYNARASGAWNFFNAQSSPACIALPLDASHVQVTMKAIYHDKIRYAVQAGGHSAMSDWNTYVTNVLFGCFGSNPIVINSFL